MTIETHLHELERRHEALDRRIEEAITQPGSDDLEIADMKKQKLRLKDEIERLREDSLH